MSCWFDDSIGWGKGGTAFWARRIMGQEVVYGGTPGDPKFLFIVTVIAADVDGVGFLFGLFDLFSYCLESLVWRVFVHVVAGSLAEPEAEIDNDAHADEADDFAHGRLPIGL